MPKTNFEVDEDDLDFADDNEIVEQTDAADDIEIDVEDDTPDEDKGRPIAADDSDDDGQDDPELKGYSKEVQARMDVLTKKRHDERRAKEAAIREKEAIHNVSAAEITRLRNELAAAKAASVTASKEQLKGEVEKIREQLKEAVELGEGTKVADLTEKLANASFKFNSAEVQETRLKEEQPAERRQEAPQKPQVSSRQEAWAKKNKWFGDNDDMTALALGVHQRLIREGVEAESEKYYNAIDREVRKRFPEEFKPSQSSRNSAPVAGVKRSAPGSGGKTMVKLTTSELKVAKSLGVTPEQYARQKLQAGRND